MTVDKASEATHDTAARKHSDRPGRSSYSSYKGVCLIWPVACVCASWRHIMQAARRRASELRDKATQPHTSRQRRPAYPRQAPTPYPPFPSNTLASPSLATLPGDFPSPSSRRPFLLPCLPVPNLMDQPGSPGFFRVTPDPVAIRRLPEGSKGRQLMRRLEGRRLVAVHEGRGVVDVSEEPYQRIDLGQWRLPMQG